MLIGDDVNLRMALVDSSTLSVFVDHTEDGSILDSYDSM